MRRFWNSRLALALVAAAMTFVLVSSTVLAVRQHSWTPILTVGWLPAVVVATWPGYGRRCAARRER
jgi:hypothetical protein